MTALTLTHTFNNTSIAQRAKDGYVDATSACLAVGKRVNDYIRLEATQAFLNALASDTGIPASRLVQITKGGVASAQGTWVHPQVAINLGQWLSPQFAVAVSKWVIDWMTKGIAPSMPRRPAQKALPKLSQDEIDSLKKELNKIEQLYEHSALLASSRMLLQNLCDNFPTPHALHADRERVKAILKQNGVRA